MNSLSVPSLPSTRHRMPASQRLGMILLTTVPRVTQAQLIQNESFESPVQGSPGIYALTLPTSWTGHPAALFRGTPFPAIWSPPQDGDQFMDIGWEVGYTLSQAFSISAAGDYQLNWYQNASLNDPPGGGSNYSGEILDALSVAVVSEQFRPGSFGVWESKSLTTFLAPGSYSVRFSSGVPVTSVDTLLDNVSLTAVPEPSEYAALAGFACAGWGLWRRRARARSAFIA